MLIFWWFAVGVVCDYRLDRRQVASTRRSHGGPGPPFGAGRRAVWSSGRTDQHQTSRLINPVRVPRFAGAPDLSLPLPRHSRRREKRHADILPHACARRHDGLPGWRSGHHDSACGCRHIGDAIWSGSACQGGEERCVRIFYYREQSIHPDASACLFSSGRPSEQPPFISAVC